jgi:uncharacterized glyoxalase superfamily protein PhnB
MRTNRSIPNVVVIPELAYPDVSEAAKWLCRAFGFRERLLIANHRAQLSVGKSGAIVVMEAPPGTETDPLHKVMVRVDNVGEHHANAQAHGAVTLRAPEDYPFGERQYTAKDFAGHLWTFTETIADVDPAQWGGTLVGE